MAADLERICAAFQLTGPVRTSDVGSYPNYGAIIDDITATALHQRRQWRQRRSVPRPVCVPRL